MDRFDRWDRGDRFDRFDRGGYGLLPTALDVHGGDVGGDGGHFGVDVAVVGGDEGGLEDGGGDEAVELDLGAGEGVGEGGLELGVGAGGGDEDGHVFGAVGDEEVDTVGVEGAADAGVGVGDGDGEGEVGDGGGSEGDGGEGSVGEGEEGHVDVGLALIVGEEVEVLLYEETPGGGALGVGLIGVAEVDCRGEESGGPVDQTEFHAMLHLCGGLGVADEGVVGTVDVAAFPEEADGGAEFADLRAEVALGVFAHDLLVLVVSFSF